MNYKEIIKKKGLKQKWIAKQLNISDALLSMFLDGKRNIDQGKEKKLKVILEIKEE